MKRLFAVLFVLAFLTFPAQAASAPPEVSAASAILIEAESGRVLYDKNADTPRLIASTTKLMTALVAAESDIPPGETFTIRREWTGIEGSSIYLREGEELSFEALLYGLLLASGNDAAVALASICAGGTEEFAARMNAKARELGMEHSHFSNPNGLDAEDHYSSAADLAKLARAVLENDLLSSIAATRSITIGSRALVNHNKLLWRLPGCIGLKTGYTEHAGRTLVSAVRRDDMTLIAVTLSDPDDWRDHEQLYRWGFETYRPYTLCRAGKYLALLPVRGSILPTVGIAAAESFSYPLAETEQVTARFSLSSALPAPVRDGDRAGEISYFLDGEEIGRVPVRTVQSIPSDSRQTNYENVK